jgi:hypothetical protein
MAATRDSRTPDAIRSALEWTSAGNVVHVPVEGGEFRIEQMSEFAAQELVKRHNAALAKLSS